MTRNDAFWPWHDAPVVREAPSETECSGSAANGWALRGHDGLILHPWNKAFGSCTPQFLKIEAPPLRGTARLDAYSAAEVDHVLFLGLPSGWLARPEGFLEFAKTPSPKFIIGIDVQHDFCRGHK